MDGPLSAAIYDTARHVESWWEASAPPPPPRPALAGEIAAEVAIIGAGYTGLACARRLAAHGIGAVVLDAAESDGKTAALARQVAALGWKRALIIDGAEINEGFARAAANIDGLDVLPSIGANVMDILRRDTLVLTKAGVEALEAQLK